MEWAALLLHGRLNDRSPNQTRCCGAEWPAAFPPCVFRQMMEQQQQMQAHMERELRSSNSGTRIEGNLEKVTWRHLVFVFQFFWKRMFKYENLPFYSLKNNCYVAAIFLTPQVKRGGKNELDIMIKHPQFITYIHSFLYSKFVWICMFEFAKSHLMAVRRT